MNSPCSKDYGLINQNFMPDLNSSQIQELQQLLLIARTELKQQLSFNTSASEPVKLDQSAVGRVSRVDAIQQQHMAVSTRRQAQQRLERLNVAIKAINNEDYGYCQDCDEPINYRRLQVQPEAVVCLTCQQKRDIST